MIWDSIANIPLLKERFPALGPAFDFLLREDLHELEPGRIEIFGKKLFANIDAAVGVGKEKARLEVHRKYLDIQVAVEGEDIIGWRHLSECQHETEPYGKDRDVGFFGDEPVSWMTLKPGDLMILWPEDAHAPLANSGPVRKIILKVAVDQKGRPSWE